jgi:hypothetical protein
MIGPMAREVRGRKPSERLDHEVNGHDVDRAIALAEPDEETRRGQPLHGSQDEVGPVELAGLAGSRVAHHHAGAIDGPGHRAFHHLHLGQELRLLVVVLEGLAHVQIALAKGPHVLPRDVGRRDVVQPVEALRALEELQHMPSPEHVDAVRRLARHRKVVDRSQVVGLGQLAAEALGLAPIDAQPGGRDVAGHEADPAFEVGMRAFESLDRLPRNP